jgi:hypothetical protein
MDAMLDIAAATVNGCSRAGMVAIETDNGA